VTNYFFEGVFTHVCAGSFFTFRDLSHAIISLSGSIVPEEVVSSNTPLLTIFGLKFKFYEEEEVFEMLEPEMLEPKLNASDVLRVCTSFFEEMMSINKNGYVSLKTLEDPNHFLRKIEKYLTDIGYKHKSLGYNNTYPLGYNFIFFNLFYLITKELQKGGEWGNTRGLIFGFRGVKT
jgi:hypothetical protein